jgi:hypothetical protein
VKTEPLTPASLCDALDALVSDFTREYEQLETLVTSHRDALRAADGETIQHIASVQHACVARIGEVDQRRRELIASAAGRFPGLAGIRPTAITITDLARCVDENHRPRMVERAGELRSLIARVQAQSASVRGATEALLAHMEGLMRHVARTMSHAGTYSRRGYVETGGVVTTALDIRS